MRTWGVWLGRLLIRILPPVWIADIGGPPGSFARSCAGAALVFASLLEVVVGEGFALALVTGVTGLSLLLAYVVHAGATVWFAMVSALLALAVVAA